MVRRNQVCIPDEFDQSTRRESLAKKRKPICFISLRSCNNELVSVQDIYFFWPVQFLDSSLCIISRALSEYA